MHSALAQNSFCLCRGRKGSSGFTLMEVLVVAAIASIGVVAVLGGLAAIHKAHERAVNANTVQKLAAEKLNDLRILSDPAVDGTGGDFTDRGYPDCTWKADVETTSITNVDEVILTVTKGDASESVTSLIYVQPASASSSTLTTSGAAS